MKAGQQLPGFSWLRDDGSTSCGNWLWCGSWTEAGALMPAPRNRRSVGPGHLSELGMVLADEPPRAVQSRFLRSQRQALGSATAARSGGTRRRKSWVGNDVPDFKADSAPKDHMGPFIMNPEGVGRLFVPLAALADGPFPEHYEPIESPIANPFCIRSSPTIRWSRNTHTDMDKYGTPEQGFTIVCTTYRLTEHYHYWTKNNPMNVQLVPEMFVEIPVELAADLGIKAARTVKVTSARATYLAKAMVTHRIRPMTIDGKKIYQIGIPIHQGYRGIQEDAGREAANAWRTCSRRR